MPRTRKTSPLASVQKLDIASRKVERQILAAARELSADALAVLRGSTSGLAMRFPRFRAPLCPGPEDFGPKVRELMEYVGMIHEDALPEVMQRLRQYASEYPNRPAGSAAIYRFDKRGDGARRDRT